MVDIPHGPPECVYRFQHFVGYVNCTTTALWALAVFAYLALCQPYSSLMLVKYCSTSLYISYHTYIITECGPNDKELL